MKAKKFAKAAGPTIKFDKDCKAKDKNRVNTDETTVTFESTKCDIEISFPKFNPFLLGADFRIKITKTKPQTLTVSTDVPRGQAIHFEATWVCTCKGPGIAKSEEGFVASFIIVD